MLRASAVVLALIAGLLAGCGGAEDAREVIRGSGAEEVTAVTQSATEAEQATDAEDAGFAGALASRAGGTTFSMMPEPTATTFRNSPVAAGSGSGWARFRLFSGEYRCRVQVRQYQDDEEAGRFRAIFSGIAGPASEAVLEPVGPEWAAEASLTVLAPEGRRVVGVRMVSDAVDAEWSVFCRYVRE